MFHPDDWMVETMIDKHHQNRVPTKQRVMVRKNLVRALLLLSVFGASPVIGAAGSLDQAPAPSWVHDIPPGTWRAVSLNSPADIDPEKDPSANPNFPSAAPWRAGQAQKALIFGWNGGAFAYGLGNKGSLLIHGGGHTSYYGNEVYAFDLESRLWRRLTNPYPYPNFDNADGSGGNPDAYPDGRFPDGTPTVPHTYDFLEYHPGTNSLVVMKATKCNTGSGCSVPVVSMLDLDTVEKQPFAQRSAKTTMWRQSIKNPLNYANDGGWSAYDAKRDVIYTEGGSGADAFVIFDPKPRNPDGSYGAFTNYPLKNNGAAEAAIDPMRDIMVVNSRRNPGMYGRAVFAFNLNDLDSPAVVLDSESNPLPGGPAFTDAESRAGFEWSKRRQAFVWWRRGGDVYEFRLAGSDWRQPTNWQWRRISQADTRVQPDEMQVDNGIFGRFRVVTYSDAEVAVVINRIEGAVYTFRMPNAVSPKAPSAVTVK